jgi:hypothetical protein
VKKSICLVFIFVFMFVTSNVSAAGNNGIGIVLGVPTGVTFQHRYTERHFADYYFAYTWDKEWMFMGDYKIHLPGLFRDVPFTSYVGVGAYFKVEDKKHNDDIALGIRVPLGVDWQVPDAPVVFFGELVPGLRIIKSTDGELQAGVGARYYY